MGNSLLATGLGGCRGLDVISLRLGELQSELGFKLSQ